MISFLVTCLFAAVILYVVYRLIGMIPLPEPIKTIVYCIVGLIAVAWVLDFTGIYHLNLNGHLLK